MPRFALKMAETLAKLWPPVLLRACWQACKVRAGAPVVRENAQATGPSEPRDLEGPARSGTVLVLAFLEAALS